MVHVWVMPAARHQFFFRTKQLAPVLSSSGRHIQLMQAVEWQQLVPASWATRRTFELSCWVKTSL
jgi:hypothetical protein